jgi:hypothetical protein
VQRHAHIDDRRASSVGKFLEVEEQWDCFQDGGQHAKMRHSDLMRAQTERNPRL